MDKTGPELKESCLRNPPLKAARTQLTNPFLSGNTSKVSDCYYRTHCRSVVSLKRPVWLSLTSRLTTRFKSHWGKEQTNIHSKTHTRMCVHKEHDCISSISLGSPTKREISAYMKQQSKAVKLWKSFSQILVFCKSVWRAMEQYQFRASGPYSWLVHCISSFCKMKMSVFWDQDQRCAGKKVCWGIENPQGIDHEG